MATKQKKEGKEKTKGHGRTRLFWVLVYFTLMLLLFIGVTLILRENVLLPTDYTPPEALLLDRPSPTPYRTLRPDETPALTPTPAPYDPGAPVRIYFESHELQADIRPVGLADDGSIDTVPSSTIAGWYNKSPYPGEPGNSIVSGHVRWDGKRGTFAVLHDMKVGEMVIIEHATGSLRYFEATNIATYTVKDFPTYITDLDGDTRLTLITCLGDYDREQGMSLSRVVVECVERRDLRYNAPVEEGEPTEEEQAEATATPKSV